MSERQSIRSPKATDACEVTPKHMSSYFTKLPMWMNVAPYPSNTNYDNRVVLFGHVIFITDAVFPGVRISKLQLQCCMLLAFSLRTLCT